MFDALYAGFAGLIANISNFMYSYLLIILLLAAGIYFTCRSKFVQLRLLGELCLPYVKVGGQFLAMKTTESASEVEEAAHCIKLLGGRAEEPVDYTIPGTQVTHRVLPIRKLAPTLKGYPRRWARIQKQPL